MITIGMLFWLMMLLWLVLDLIGRYRTSPQPALWPIPGDLFIFILLFLLGVQVFGWPIRT
jgi:hypothetical protein